MGEPLRIGLVGCGAMGQGHLAVWAETEGARITAVCDADARRGGAVAASCGAAAFTDIAAMLDSGRIDAVDICTPSGLHADQGLAAARRGLHVLVEKPMDLDHLKARSLVAECDARGLVLACVLQRRTSAPARQVADAVARGEMGSLLSCSAYVKWWRSPDYYRSAGWRGTRTLDGGVLANQAIHALDHMCWLAGPVAEVEYARLGPVCHDIEAEDFAIAVLRFECGALGVIEATTCCSPDLCARLEVFGTRGSAAFDDANVVSFGIDGESRLATLAGGREALGGRSDPMAISLDGHRVILQDFASAVRQGREPLVPGREALHAVVALGMIYRSACSRGVGQRLPSA